MARLFVAVWPPDEVVRGLSSLERREDPAVRWTTQDQWHVTLLFLGEAEETDAVASMVRLDHPAVTATLGPSPVRLASGVLALPVVGLDALASEVVSVFEAHPQRPFHGHLTLARTRGRHAKMPRPSWSLAVSWQVTEVTLVRSELHPQGARYDVVRSVTLTES